MNCRFVLVVFGGLAIHPLTAQTPTACAGQLVPVKSPMIFCSNAAPVCVTDRNGLNGRWVWGCPTSTEGTQSPANVLDAITNYNPTDFALTNQQEAEKLRSLRLQNQQMEQQIKNLQQQRYLEFSPSTPKQNLAAIALGLKEGYDLDCKKETVDQDTIKLTCSILINWK